jgi:hypothetical protein
VSSHPLLLRKAGYCRTVPVSDQGELRGVAIFRVGIEQTAKLTEDDPTVKAGLLRAEIHPWGTGKGALASGQPTT